MSDSNMVLENLSVVQQEYIETIHSLCKGHEHAHTKDIADILNVSMPSVVDALQSLAKVNLINYQARQPVTLTQSGEEVAETLTIRHKALADFFVNVLGFGRAYSEKTACIIEHVVDENFNNRLSGFSTFLKKDKDALNIVNRFKSTL